MERKIHNLVAEIFMFKIVSLRGVAFKTFDEKLILKIQDYIRVYPKSDCSVLQLLGLTPDDIYRFGLIQLRKVPNEHQNACIILQKGYSYVAHFPNEHPNTCGIFQKGYSYVAISFTTNYTGA